METKKCRCCGRELPLDEFTKNGFGYTNVCKECNSKNRSESQKRRKALKQQAVDALNARNLRLQDFSPRELMTRLKELGYEGTLTYTRVETIDITKL